MNEAKKQQDSPSFETAMERLEDIVSSMEGERMSLEDMVASYEEGVKLLRICRQRIDTAKQRVELITADLEGGKANLTPFDPTSAADSSAADADDSAGKGKARRTKTDSKNDDIRLF